MAIWLDIIASFIFGGLLALNVMRMNADMTAQSYRSTLTYIAQSSAVTIAQILEEDFRRMGFGVSGTVITLADSSQVKFRVDFDADGSADSLNYYISDTAEASATPNPDDRVLYRVLNEDTPQGMRLGETEFRLSYFKANGDSLAMPVAAPDSTRRIRMDLIVESKVAYDTTYARAFIQLRFQPRNLGP